MTERIEEFFIEVVAYANGEIVKTLGPYPNERQRDRADDGVNRNLDHERYFTRMKTKVKRAA